MPASRPAAERLPPSGSSYFSTLLGCRNAQSAYTAWSKLPIGQRTTARLQDMLDFDFFEVLDQVTIARSRRHIQQYYDTAALGPFPRRLPPIPRDPSLSTLPGAINYREIYAELDSLTLSVYMPSAFLQDRKSVV